MTIIDLLRTEAVETRRTIVIAAALAGAANALLLSLVNVAALSPGEPQIRMLLLYLLAMALFVLGAHYTYKQLIRLIEMALHRVRCRIIVKLERTDYERMECLGTAEIMDRFTENTTVVSDAAAQIAAVLQSAWILMFATVYLASQSFTAFILLSLIIGGGVAMFMSMSNEANKLLQQTARERLVFFDLMTDLLRGFKEIKFSERRGRELRADIEDASQAMSNNTAQTNLLFQKNLIFANCNLFIALGMLVFAIPQHMAIESTTLTSLVAGVMFVWSSVGGIAMGYPMYVRANHGLAQIADLERKLDDDTRDMTDSIWDPWRGRFASSITARALEYEYPVDGDRRFRIGPLDLTITAGEVLFLVGGNGSGKSTMLKLLTSLYTPTAGNLSVDGVKVEPDNAPAYRELISTIYSDFHLFSKLYGLLDVEETAVQRLLDRLGLARKTGFAHQQFVNRNLSTGQRKRLALIVALLEDRPILFFDEWAADQDPHFRRYFYEDLLSELRNQGKTVIAVTHDDRYFHCADRVVTMDYGTIRTIESRDSGHR